MKLKALLVWPVSAGLVALSLTLHGCQSSGADATMRSRPVAPDLHAAAVGVADFSAIVAKYGPAVVSISAAEPEKAATITAPWRRLDENDPFYWFFRQLPTPREYVVRGFGSGFIVRPDGIVLTSAHVVDNASEVTVKLVDRREFKAKVLGVDNPTDIAVLKIEANNLPTVKLGSSADVNVGEWVVAVGSSLGFENSATAGIVSGTLRTLPQESYVPFIETDVAFNPGNSGGPLFDARGEVIGVNSPIHRRSGGYQGLSFAIPIDVATSVASELLATGRVARSRLGLTVQDVSQSLANAFSLGQPSGALVTSVETGGPAAKAGLEPGDVIVKFNDKNISTSSDLPFQLANTKPDTRATLDIVRDGVHRQVDVTLGELKSGEIASTGSAKEQSGRLGLAVRPLTPQETKALDVSGGLMVNDSSGPAATAGIEPGDVILSLNGTKITNVQQLRSLASKAGKSVAILIQRDKQRIFVSLRLG